jgi:hypothetical protein
VKGPRLACPSPPSPPPAVARLAPSPPRPRLLAESPSLCLCAKATRGYRPPDLRRNPRRTRNCKIDVYSCDVSRKTQSKKTDFHLFLDIPSTSLASSVKVSAQVFIRIRSVHYSEYSMGYGILLLIKRIRFVIKVL